MPARLKLIIAYDGTPFAGWQSQARGDTIQDRLENVFRQVCGQEVRVHGAGRTDAGVHALAQCAHVDVPNRRLTSDRWTLALNGLLPPAIRVMRCRYVSSEFHARFQAKGKSYRYRIWNGQVLPPFEDGRAWHVTSSLDLSAMKRAAQKFVGRHDFGGFAANRGTPETDTVRNLRAVVLRQRGALISLEFEGDGFLYKMVRMLVGVLVQVGQKKCAADEIDARFDGSRKIFSRARLVAPAGGLSLIRVRY
ncbi:MAG: tRNA pseudouridine(38-40) synthase TruA [Verrucomicrobiota bacterium]